MTEPILQAVETAAVPLIESAVKVLEPEAAQLVEEFRQFAYDKEQKLAADVHQLLVDHHSGLLGWLVDRLGTTPSTASTAVDPTSAVPAPQS